MHTLWYVYLNKCSVRPRRFSQNVLGDTVPVRNLPEEGSIHKAPKDNTVALTKISKNMQQLCQVIAKMKKYTQQRTPQTMQGSL